MPRSSKASATKKSLKVLTDGAKRTKSHENPLNAIAAWCLDCSGNSKNEREKCIAKHCPLYPFRLGKNPFITRDSMSKDHRAANAARMRAMHAKKQEEQCSS